MNTIEQLQQRLATEITSRTCGDGYVLTTKKIAPPIRCMDGVYLSVQASSNHYSSPRTNAGPWTQVEVGYPRDSNGAAMTMPDSWVEYAESGESISDIFGYIPLELVAQFIDEHGGIKD